MVTVALPDAELPSRRNNSGKSSLENVSSEAYLKTALFEQDKY